MFLVVFEVDIVFLSVSVFWVLILKKVMLVMFLFY